jgi:3-oxoacyl-[acyl-carrier protein] reductase
MKVISLKGRKAFVTGGSRGIGAEICRTFAECGADVAFTYKSDQEKADALVEEMSRYSAKAHAYKTSAEDENGMAEVIKNAAGFLGGLDLLVVNVANAQIASINELSMEDWRGGLEINLTAAFLAIKLIYPYMCNDLRGDILLIGSSAAYDGGGPVPYYAAAKAGMGGLCRHLMRELSQNNIRINTIHPCVVDTDGLRKAHRTPEALEKIRKQVPLGRLSKTEDIANLAAFICSDLCEFITGQSILVDGGRTLWKKACN